MDKTKIVISYILIFLLVSICPVLIFANDQETEKLFANNYKIITTVDQLPYNLKQTVEGYLHTSLDMTNPDQSFEESDVIDLSKPRLPKRRLIFAGVSDKYSFIYYAHGGFVRNDCLIFVENNGANSKVVFSGIFFKGPAHSITELGNYLNEDWFLKTVDAKQGNY